VVRVDEFIDELLTKDYACDIALPRLPKRWHLEEAGMLEPRVSLAEEALEDSEEEDEGLPADQGAEAQGDAAVAAAPVSGHRVRSAAQEVAEGKPSVEAKDRRRNDSPRGRRRNDDPRHGVRSGERRDDRRRSGSRSRSREPSRRRSSRSRSDERRRESRRSDRSRSPRRSHQRRSRSPRRGDRRDEERSRSSSEERKKCKRSSKAKKRANDALFKKQPADEKHPEGKGGGGGGSKGEGGGDGLSIEETNKLRVSLGLKPLK